jgi:SAM-dependent methyltransferase
MEADIQKKIQNYYDEKLKLHGATAQGVDWKNFDSQETRFSLLAEVFKSDTNYEVNDLGCGYGAFFQYLQQTEAPFHKYYGYDISAEMIREAKQQFGEHDKCDFIVGGVPEKHQFTISSGIMNVRLDVPEAKWEEVIQQLLETMFKSSSVGFSFNMLKQPTDEIYRRDYLYYADPVFYQDMCERNYGKDVQILSHPSLFEFTVLVRALR